MKAVHYGLKNTDSHCVTESSASLYTGAESNLRDRGLGEVEKDSFITLLGKGGYSGLLPSKTMCPNQGGFDEGFYNNGSKMGSLTRLGGEQGLQSLNLISGGLLILMSFSGPFNLASDGFLAAPLLISYCLNLPFGTQGRSWRLESCLQEMGDKRASVTGSPTGPHSVSIGLIEIE